VGERRSETREVGKIPLRTQKSQMNSTESCWSSKLYDGKHNAIDTVSTIRAEQQDRAKSMVHRQGHDPYWKYDKRGLKLREE
jgi:hypothetical protein